MSRSIDPIVSTEWLETRLSKGGPTVIDIRWEEEYQAGHLPGAISIPFAVVSAWADSDDELILELPPEEDLLKLVGDCGLTADAEVVIVGRVEPPPAPPYPLADAVRAAVTLIYAGLENVAVLAGGHPKWAEEQREITTRVPRVEPLAYRSAFKAEMFVSTEYVKEHIGKSVIVDGRDADQYFGVSIDPFVDMRGHIPTARSLPLVWVWEGDGTYRPPELIRNMATGVIGEDREQEVIAYCGVGGYASTWWFLLTQLLGYRNVKIYDGSMEAWVQENPIVAYTWTA
jgi:thiosulfate/3-mercaptopyruvate sulfurtransferase